MDWWKTVDHQNQVHDLISPDTFQTQTELPGVSSSRDEGAFFVIIGGFDSNFAVCLDGLFWRNLCKVAFTSN